ncbi:MAG: hypothetical protein U9R34_06570 [Nanoarchaeota archaeon]|nr:hypothetical protein [Nanoarchaeota archaeon]
MKNIRNAMKFNKILLSVLILIFATGAVNAATEVIELSTDADLIINGIDEMDYSSHSVSSGDINGDGIDDVIIGAYYADPYGKSSGGETYVIFGGVTGEINLSTDADLTINAIDGADYSGWAVSSGDINNDSIDDVIIGANLADPNGHSMAGETYVVFGGVTGEINLSTGANLTINGITGGDQSGISVSSGDINGDGIDDVIISAYFADPNGILGAGETYVIFGGETLSEVIELSDADLTINGIDNGDNSGHSVSSGDINGDGIDDVIIGARYAAPNGNTNAGETYVVFGGVTGEINLSTDADLTINGINEEDFSGHSVSSGDINNDTIDDVIIGAYRANPNGNTDAGETYVVFGGVTGVINLSTDADLTLIGIDGYDSSGYSVSSGDINNNSIDDLIIGAYAADPNGKINGGETYVIFGSETMPAVIDLSDADLTINAIDGGDGLGWSVSSGDINNDSIDDVIIGARYASANGNYGAGETYAVFWSASGTEPIYSNFAPASETTNFSEAGDMANVANVTLAITGKAKIKFPDDYTINSDGEDYNTNVLMEDGSIGVNTSALHSTFNSSAILTFYNADCDTPSVYHSETSLTRYGIISEGNICSAPLCTNILCTDGTLTVNVSHFTGYGVNLSVNLTIDADDPKNPGQLVTFTAIYQDANDGFLNESTCNISFSDGSHIMDEQADHYNYSRTFATAQTVDYNVTCSKVGYSSVFANDTALIAPNIPEFSTITLGLGLIAVLGGLFIIRKKK